MMTPILYIPVGIPGCGKTTLAHQGFGPGADRIIVSTDEIRKEIFTSLKEAHLPDVKERANRDVFQIFHERIAEHLEAGRAVFADATNLESRGRRTLREIASKHEAAVYVYLFTNIPRAVRQNRMRDEDAIVPDDVMDRMVQKFLVAERMVFGEEYSAVFRPRGRLNSWVIASGLTELVN